MPNLRPLIECRRRLPNISCINHYGFGLASIAECVGMLEQFLIKCDYHLLSFCTSVAKLFSKWSVPMLCTGRPSVIVICRWNRPVLMSFVDTATTVLVSMTYLPVTSFTMLNQNASRGASSSENSTPSLLFSAHLYRFFRITTAECLGERISAIYTS